MTPESRPTPQPPVLAIQFIINGDGTSIHCNPQGAADSGTNVTAGGPVTAVGAHGSMTGGQAVQAGRDATAARAEDQPPKKSWWARLRERGLIVAIATVVGAIAVVVGTAVTICAWIGLIP
jgi:hypothetical protein